MSDNIFKNWLDSSYLTQNNQLYIEQIYKNFLKDPNSVDISWCNVFKQIYDENNFYESSYVDLYKKDMSFNKFKNDHDSNKLFLKDQINKDLDILIKVLQLINAFRTYGYQYAELDPLNLYLNKIKNIFLELEYYKFTDQDLKKIFNTAYFGMNKGFLSLLNIFKLCRKMYCGSIGIEYMHIPDIIKIFWVQNYFESKIIDSKKFSDIEQENFLEEIIAAEGLEHYLGSRFPGAKRFSLEGCDVLIPMLKEITRYSATRHNIREIFIGMAHRGRLNVLINVLGKNPQDLFNEFCNINKEFIGSGDVKYHQGLYSDIKIDGCITDINLSLLFNPSHLEIITPIVIGAVRAKIDQLCVKSVTYNHLSDKNKTIITPLPIIIHGDAAVSAQGVVQESFNMSNTYAYNVKGSIHIVINNQIGFTTSNVYNIRSTPYCTDIAKMVNAPIFHVNADDINAVIFVTRFALDFRKKFKNDVVIDLVCYRRHGHNESDEPSVTQPIMYQKIKKHPTAVTVYYKVLNKIGIINSNKIKSMEHSYRTKLEKTQCCLSKTWTLIGTTRNINDINQKQCYLDNFKIDDQYLKKLAYNISNIPSCITMHDRVKKIYNERIEMALGKRLFDWGGAEILAYAALLDQGYSIRLSGEDVARGTFFHRHAVIHDQNNGSTYIPLMHISKNQGSFFVWDSVLSEESALAFEYGYAHMALHSTLVIWEAQFGDFANGAQVVIDQFISSSEHKWGQLCGLVMLLPHGYEGQGPEHSSCRIERYLQLCAEYNMKVCIPSTPAQIFHVLYQQAHNNIRRPLIVVSPKSLLRHAMVTSSIKDLVCGSFSTIFNEKNTNCMINQVVRIIICTGKIYYDLIQKRDCIQNYRIAIIRIEQLYPFPDQDIKTVLKLYSYVKDFIWCQEEPENQGAWYYMQRCFYKNFSLTLKYVGRPDSAAPAVGYFSEHQKQQNKIINDALDLN